MITESRVGGETDEGNKSVRGLLQKSFTSSPPAPQVKDSQARTPRSAPAPSAVPQELPGCTPTAPARQQPCLSPPTQPASSTRHPLAGGSSLSDWESVRKAKISIRRVQAQRQMNNIAQKRDICRYCDDGYPCRRPCPANE